MFQEMKYILFGFMMILFVNLLIQYSYPYFGCTEMSTTNIFRGNLLCVAFTNINYHVQQYQIQFYLAIAGYLLQNANNFIQEFLKIKLD
jgi:hypothetical protein